MNVTNLRNAALLAIVALVAVVGAIMLAAIGKPIPDQLWTVATFALGGAAGVTHPHATATKKD